MTMLRYNSAGCYLDAEYQMSNALAGYKWPDQSHLKWLDEYNKLILTLGRTPPRPGMYNGKPCFYGGLSPIRSLKLKETQIIIFNHKFKYMVVEEEDIALPSDQEYKQYFQSIIRSGIVTLSTMQATSRYPKHPNGEEYVFIQIKDKRFRWFDNYIRPWEPYFKRNVRNIFRWVVTFEDRV